MAGSLKGINASVCRAVVILFTLTSSGFSVTDEDPITGNLRESSPPTLRQQLTQHLVRMFPFSTSPRYDTPRFSTGNRGLLDILDTDDGLASPFPLPQTTPPTTTSAHETQSPTPLPTSWGRMEAGTHQGVVDFHGGPLTGVPCQSPSPLTAMTPEQREKIDQHIRLIKCRIKNCCGPKADQ